MKIVIVGAGSYRVLGIMRSTLAIPGVLDGGEINLYDLDHKRSGAMGQLILKTPEVKRAGCKVTWGTTLEEALEGASAVGIILQANKPMRWMLQDEVAFKHGFISSDNVSPSGAMAALAISPVILNIARKMEQYCPNAWLLNFVNPINVISGMVNNHTKIKALGLCGGFTNHLSDIPRIFGTDEETTELEAETAGINHLSFIRKATYKGRDLFPQLDAHLAKPWKMCKLQDWWPEGAKGGITNSVTQLVRFYQELGVLIFSTEGDGMDHLMYDEAVARFQSHFKKLSKAQMEANIEKGRAQRAEEDRTFQEHLTRELDQEFWDHYWKKDHRFKPVPEDAFVRIFTALAGVKPIKIAASRPNHGSIPGLKDRYAIEATYTLTREKLVPVEPHEVPDIVQGVIAGLAAHQTVLGDAIALDDPKLLAEGLLAYPMKAYTPEAKACFKEMLEINREALSPNLQKAVEFIR
jgi:alpha-galactosidase/6-phospho-beta-glucosidase family protein